MKPKILIDIENKIDKDLIVNDLTTGGADKVASAETVKILNNSKAPTLHTHTKANITDFPTSLPANGGNADTLDGLDNEAFVKLSGFKKIIANNTDLNTVTGIGSYTTGSYSETTNIINSPTGNVPFNLWVISLLNTSYYITQIILVYNSKIMFIRTTTDNGNTWTTWEILGASVFAPKNHAENTGIYGTGNTTNYGHVRVIDNLSQTIYAPEALSARQGNILQTSKAPSHQSGTATPSAFVGEGVLYGVHS